MKEKLIDLLMDLPITRLTYEEMEKYSGIVAGYLIANDVTIQKWIPVSERLPEADKNVLVCTIHGSFKVAGCNFYKNGTEVSWATNDGFGERAITHWMPLPEPPKGEV